MLESEIDVLFSKCLEITREANTLLDLTDNTVKRGNIKQEVGSHILSIRRALEVIETTFRLNQV